MYPHVRFEVLTAVKMKITVFWDKAPCSLADKNQYCGGTCLLHLQGWRQQVPIQHTTCHHILEGCYLNYFSLKFNSISWRSNCRSPVQIFFWQINCYSRLNVVHPAAIMYWTNKSGIQCYITAVVYRLASKTMIELGGKFCSFPIQVGAAIKRI